MSESQAIEYIEQARWPNGPACPHCGGTNVTRLQGKAHRPRLIQCKGCRKQFTVTVGTAMECSRLPFLVWASELQSPSRSALKLMSRFNIGSYKTALFVFHRVRHLDQFWCHRTVVERRQRLPCRNCGKEVNRWNRHFCSNKCAAACGAISNSFRDSRAPLEDQNAVVRDSILKDDDVAARIALRAAERFGGRHVTEYVGIAWEAIFQYAECGDEEALLKMAKNAIFRFIRETTSSHLKYEPVDHRVMMPWEQAIVNEETRILETCGG